MTDLANLTMAPYSTLLQASVMENSEVRLINLKLLHFRERGTQKDFAEKIGTTPNTLNQMLTRHRNVGTQTARKVEKRLKLSLGWMDQPRPKEWETMMLASFEQPVSRARILSRNGVNIAARVDSLMDDDAVELILHMLDRFEAQQAAKIAAQSLTSSVPPPGQPSKRP